MCAHRPTERLRGAQARLHAFLVRLARDEGVRLSHRRMARFEPVAFAPDMIERVERAARALGLSVRRMPSGAGYDDQSFPPNCPTGMIFVPSVGGISHNVHERTDDDDIEHGANVLLRVLLELAT